MAFNTSQLGMVSDFWPGTNVTSYRDGQCYGNFTLCFRPSLFCTLKTCDLSLAQYDYLPSLAGNALYAAIFGVCIVAQLALGIRYKTWGFMGAVTLGLITEVIGYIGRIMAHSDPFKQDPFLIYLVCLTIAPALICAGIYLCLARIVVVYGENLSRFRPRTYTIVFCTFDFISLLLQAIGGAIASTATTRSAGQMGINIMLAGLSFQVFSLLVFAACCIEFALRLRKQPHAWSSSHSQLYGSPLFKAFLVGLSTAVLTIFVRSCFRVAELSAGFNGALANDEVTFMVLEGMMIVIAALCLTVLHPGVCFGGVWQQANFKMKGTKRRNVDKATTSSASSAGYEFADTPQYARVS